MLWCIAEPAIGIISICLPSFFYLAKRAKTQGVGALFTSKNRRPKPVDCSTQEKHMRHITKARMLMQSVHVSNALSVSSTSSLRHSSVHAGSEDEESRVQSLGNRV